MSESNKLPSAGHAQGSFTSSASVILRRRAHGFSMPATTTNGSSTSNNRSCSISSSGLDPADDDMKNDARILSRQLIDDRRGDSFCQRRRGSDPQFSGVRIRKKLDVLDALLEFVEGGDASFEQ